MARCGCSGGSCACTITVSSLSDCLSITKTGVGSLDSPYVITTDLTLSPSVSSLIDCTEEGLVALADLDALDTDCINMTVTGMGTIGSPWVVSADITLDPDESNQLICTEDGLYAPPVSGVFFGDSDCIELTGAGTVEDPITAELVIDPDGDNLFACGVSGITVFAPAVPETLIIAASDETTAITTGTAKVTFRMPFAMTLTSVRASLTTASSSGTPTFDINESGTTVLSTKITIDVGEKTSTTAAVPPVISDASLADDAEITIDFDVAGTDTAGVKIYLIGTRT